MTFLSVFNKAEIDFLWHQLWFIYFCTEEPTWPHVTEYVYTHNKHKLCIERIIHIVSHTIFGIPYNKKQIVFIRTEFKELSYLNSFSLKHVMHIDAITS